MHAVLLLRLLRFSQVGEHVCKSILAIVLKRGTNWLLGLLKLVHGILRDVLRALTHKLFRLVLVLSHKWAVLSVEPDTLQVLCSSLQHVVLWCVRGSFLNLRRLLCLIRLKLP